MKLMDIDSEHVGIPVSQQAMPTAFYLALLTILCKLLVLSGCARNHHCC